MEELLERVRNRTLTRPALDVSAYVDAIVKRYADRVVGVFMYGSLLSDITATATSFPDFFVITDGYRNVFLKKRERLLAYPVPPHIYHLAIGAEKRCKYNLVSFNRFDKECSNRATDIYILGRFGKRVSLVYSQNAEWQEKLVQCCLRAMTQVAKRTLYAITEPMDEIELTVACLNISYAGETRVEEAGQKVPKLFEAEKEFYLQVYPPLLARAAKNASHVVLSTDGRYQPIDKGLGSYFRKSRARWFLFKSRVRGILRWPKFLLTVDDWVSILLAKIERTQGIKIELSEKERRHPLIYGWKYFFRLLRQGAIGSAKTSPGKKS